jgi:superfamily I DNA/RNA helicase
LATRDIPRAIEKFGSDKVMVVSFTRSGAHEIATKRSRETGRKIEIDEKMIGTIHSICYHALGCPTIAETLTDQWNIMNPNETISPSRKFKDELESAMPEQKGSSKGEDLLRDLNIKRNRRVPVTGWSPTLQDFNKRWTQFKQDTDSLDFTDMIDQCLRDKPYAPGRPDVLVVDEAQDSTKLQVALFRSWGQDCKWIVLTGDDDQCMYLFAGASPDVMLSPEIPDSDKIILKQSYRVPKAVLERAMRVVHRIENRQEKIYAPRKERNGDTAEGIVQHFSASFREPDPLISAVKEKIAEGKSVMILTSCSYMLKGIQVLLKRSGIPFWNRYRPTRGDWNPLSAGRGDSARDILIAFNERGSDGDFWNVPQFVRWARHLHVGESGLKKKVGKAGIKLLREAVKENRGGLHTTREVISQVMTESACERALERDIKWFKDNLVADKIATMEYPIEVLKNYDIFGLESNPLVTIGTIHSVKGGEADIVYLFPDISLQAEEQMEKREGRDAIHRVFYVGMTRAKQELYLMDPAVKQMKGRPNRMFVEL